LKEPTQSNWNRLHLAKERAGQGQQHTVKPDFDSQLDASNAPEAIKNHEKLGNLLNTIEKHKSKSFKLLNTKQEEDPLKAQRRQNLNNRFSRRNLTVRDRLHLVTGQIKGSSPDYLDRQRDYLKQDTERKDSLKQQGKVIKDQLKSKPKL